MSEGGNRIRLTARCGDTSDTVRSVGGLDVPFACRPLRLERCRDHWAAPSSPSNSRRRPSRSQQGAGGRGGRRAGPRWRTRRRRAAAAEWRVPARHDRVAPGSCRAPEFPAPSIVDYRPRTTLKTEEHLVPKAKFPVVDSHNHTTVNADNIEQLIQEMDALNLRVAGQSERRRRSRAGQAEGGLHPREQVSGSLPRLRQRAVERRRGTRVGREGRGRPRAGRQEWRDRAQDRQGPGPRQREGRRLAAPRRRPGARSRSGTVRAPEHPGHHPHRRAAGVLLAARSAQRALARTGALSPIAATMPPGNHRPRSTARCRRSRN